MKFLKLPLAYLLLISVVAVPVSAQQRRQTPEKPQPKTPAAPSPPPAPVDPLTLDTLLAAGSYKVYGEVRGVGQLIRSNAANDALEPILKLGGPPKDFVNVVNWLKDHADQLMTSRLMVGVSANANDIPDVVVAIEFSSPEEAAKLEPEMTGVLTTILPPVLPAPSPEAEDGSQEKAKEESQNKAAPSRSATEAPQETPQPVPGYYLKRFDSLLIISEKPVDPKKLRPAGSKLFSEDPEFRVAYNRFISDPVFVFVNIATIEKARKERQKEMEEEWQKQEEARKAAQEQARKTGEKEENEEEEESGDADAMPEEAAAAATVQPEPPPAETTPKEPTESELLMDAVIGLSGLLFNTSPILPSALGIGFAPDYDSFDLRVLMIDPAGQRSDPIPILSSMKLGAPLTPQSPGVLPGDTELAITLSLDFDAINELVSTKESPPTFFATLAQQPGTLEVAAMKPPSELASPLKTIERILKINVRDDLLPLVGPEVAVGMPMGEFGLFGPPRTTPPQSQNENDAKPAARSPFVVISVRDRDGMRKLMSKILEGFAGKAAAAMTRTERREDTEIVYVANAFAYAFIGDFLVLSPDAATTSYVVDSYLKGETLSANVPFKTYTRWQPRQMQAQFYLSPAFAESYKTWASSPNVPISDDARAFVARVSTTPQPITYSLSNDGLGTLHEVHVPKSLVVTALAGFASAANPPETVKNERSAMGIVWSIYAAEVRYKEEKKSGYAAIEELVAAEMLSEETIDKSGYKFEIRIKADGFEISAVPVEYGKTGKLSLYLDSETKGLRGADRGGTPANASDPPVAW